MTMTTEAPVVADQRAALATPLGFDAFLAWAKQGERAEWVAGESVLLSPDNDRHQELVLFLATILNNLVQIRQRGRLFALNFLMRLATRPSGRVPDLLFVTTEHLDRIQHGYLDGPADIVVEIVSLDSAARDRGEKFVEYEADGVQEYWLLDPLRQDALFYQRDAQGRYRRVITEAEGIYRSAVLAGCWRRVDWLWQRPHPTPLAVMQEWDLLPRDR